MTYNDAVEVIRNKPRFCVGLWRIEKLNKVIGSPDKKLKFIHIAGTNGKGSTANMIMNVLIAAGYNVGLFSSPYLCRINEYMKINGKPVSDEEFSEIIGDIEPFAEQMDEPVTEFEFVTEVALEYFARNNCDIVVLEVGMGGRLDCTNIISHTEVAVITSIGLDHMEVLGNTVEEIAAEKAGIIKSGSDVILYQQAENIHEVVRDKCSEEGVPLHIAEFSDIIIKTTNINGQIFNYGQLENIQLPLLGTHQLKNASVAIETINALKRRGWKIETNDIYTGLAKTMWPARFELLQKSPIVILDGGHNPQCFEAVAESLQLYFPKKKVIFVMGVFRDKEYEEMLKIVMPYAQKFYTVTPNNDRALSAECLANYISDYHIPVRACGEPLIGVKCALEEAKEDDIICILGTFSIACSIRSFFEKS